MATTSTTKWVHNPLLGPIISFIMTEQETNEHLTMTEETLPQGSTTELRDNIIRVHHGGATNNWICTKCDRNFNAPSILIKHIKAHHQCITIFACTKCDQVECESSRSVATHMRACSGPKVIQNLEFKCDLCIMSFKTKVGRTQHMRIKHPKEYNDSLQPQKSKKYLEIELRDMAKIEAKCRMADEDVRKALDLIRKAFPDRTVAFYKIRQGEVYKAFLNNELDILRADIEEVPEVPEELIAIGKPELDLNVSNHEHEPLDLNQSLELEIVLIRGNPLASVKEAIDDFVTS